MKKKSKRVRKPREFKSWLLWWEIHPDNNKASAYGYSNTFGKIEKPYIEHLCVEDIRKLAAWLTKAADYLEQETRK